MLWLNTKTETTIIVGNSPKRYRIMRLAQAGDTVLLVNERDRRRFVRTLEPGKSLQTHRGKVEYDQLIGQPLGVEIRTHLGFPYYLLLPTTDDLVTNAIRKSQ